METNYTTKEINSGLIMDAVKNTTLPEDKQNAQSVLEDNQKTMQMIAEYKMRHTPKVKEYNIGRNDPCPCGSGKKYKKCCLSSGKYEKLIPKK